MLQKAKVANFAPRSSIIFPAYADLSHSPPSWNSWIDTQFLNGYKSLINIVPSVCRSLQRADVALLVKIKYPVTKMKDIYQMRCFMIKT